MASTDYLANMLINKPINILTNYQDCYKVDHDG